MKKGQILGEPIKFAFYAFVAIIILIFGAKLVFELSNFGRDITEKSLLIDVNSKFKSISQDSYGSVTNLENIKVPKDMQEICLVDHTKTLNLSKIKSNFLKKFIGESSESNIKDNMFILGKDSSNMAHTEIRNLVLDEFVLCDDLSDYKINIKLINQGSQIKAEAIS